jgi:hypothetical protein
MINDDLIALFRLKKVFKSYNFMGLVVYITQLKRVNILHVFQA